MKLPALLSPALLLRLAAACTAFFAAGHTAGHLARHAVTGPARPVVALMQSQRFDFNGALRTYDEFYTGMSLNLIGTLLLLTVLLWNLARFGGSAPRLCARLLLPVNLLLLAFAWTSATYFFVVPAVTCLLAVLCVSLAHWQLAAAARATNAPSGSAKLELAA